MNQIIIDATNYPLGRLASFAAKQALFGRSVIIINCNYAVISGRKPSIVSKYKKARARKSTAFKGPNFPRTPERIVKRTVRGMLPYRKGKGNETFKRVICYNETPNEYENSQKIKSQKPITHKVITLKELSRIV